MKPDAARPAAATLRIMPAEEAAARAALAACAGLDGALLPVLHGVQDRLGYVPAAVVPLIATALNLSRAEVHGVISYYHHFRERPAGRVVVQICRAEACQASGAAALIAHAERVTGCALHATRADGQVTLEPVYCLGQCAIGPALTIGAELHGRVDATRFNELFEAACAAAGA